MSNRTFAAKVATVGLAVKVVTCHLLVQDTNIFIVDSFGNNIGTKNSLLADSFVAVLRLSAGKYNFVLRDTYRKLLYAGAHYRPIEEDVDLYAQIEIDTLVTFIGSTITPRGNIHLKTGSVSTDPSATGGIIELLLIFEDSRAAPG